MSEIALQERLHQRGHPVDLVSTWLSQGKLRCFEWHSLRWLPMFQLSADGASLRQDVLDVAEELSGAMDDLEILAWFACPNGALGDQTPIASLRHGIRPVVEAARLDHFLASA